MNVILRRPAASRRPLDAYGAGLALALLLWLGLVRAAIAVMPDGPDLARLDGQLAGLVHNGVVIVGDGERVIYRYPRNATGSFIPASIIKYAVALAAIDELGADYRFRTEVYRGEGDTLVVRGYGDPMLVSEQWRRMAEALAAHPEVPRRIARLVLDDSAFDDDITIPGSGDSLNPYDADTGALATNFNTVNVEVLRDGTVRSGESQTPLTPLARQLGQRLGGGRHRVNITRWGAMALPYTGQVLRAMLLEAGLDVAPALSHARVGAGARLLLTHRSSDDLLDVIQAMMQYSNNFIANQLLLVTGLEAAGEPATLEKGLARLRSHLVDGLGIDAGAFTITEASGISRRNRITGDAMLSLLRAFAPYRGLLATYRDTPVQLKTGTLDGVYSLAGYVDTASGDTLHVVIILNQRANTRDRILAALNHALR